MIDGVGLRLGSLARDGLASNTRVNVLNLLSSIFELAVERGWAVRNPVRNLVRPRGGSANADIRCLTIEEVEALLRAVPDDGLGRVERPLYLAAAMTGMRQGELLALRWSDLTSTRRQSASAFDAVTSAASSGRRSCGVQSEACR